MTRLPLHVIFFLLQHHLSLPVFSTQLDRRRPGRCLLPRHCRLLGLAAAFWFVDTAFFEKPTPPMLPPQRSSSTATKSALRWSSDPACPPNGAAEAEPLRRVQSFLGADIAWNGGGQLALNQRSRTAHEARRAAARPRTKYVTTSNFIV